MLTKYNEESKQKKKKIIFRGETNRINNTKQKGEQKGQGERQNNKH